MAEHHENPLAIWSNLRQPMPIGRKLRLLIANNLIKIKTRRSCCGNYGQPGC